MGMQRLEVVEGGIYLGTHRWIELTDGDSTHDNWQHCGWIAFVPYLLIDNAHLRINPGGTLGRHRQTAVG